MEKFNYKHSLGQNFLQDKKVLTTIVDSVDVKENDLIVEIGPGKGALTKYLKLFKTNLLCFEIDKRVKNDLEKFKDSKTNIIFDDFMNVDLNSCVKSINYDDLYVIANIPYYITTPIIEKVINSGLNPKALVLMVQNEVALRLSSDVGSRNYGAITVYLNYFFKVERVMFVDRKCFYPVPNVDSAVIKLERRDHLLELANMDHFKKLVKDAFHMKRKNIRNNLKEYNLDIIEKVLANYDLNLNDRAEKVCVECFVDMSNMLFKDSK